MKILITIFIFFCAFNGMAQVVSQKIDSLKIRSLKVDTLRNKTDSPGSSIVARKDSTMNSIRQQQDQIKKLSLDVSSFKQGLREKIDSVKGTPRPDTLLLVKLGHLESKTDSLKNAMSNATTNANGAVINEQLDKIRNVTTSITGKVQNPINDQVSKFQQNGAEGLSGINLPALPVDQLPIGNQNLNLPDLQVNNLTLDQTASTPTTPFPEIKHDIQPNLPDVKDPTELGISKSLEDPVNKLSGDLPVDKLEKLSSASPESLEDEIGNVKALSGVTAELSEADRMKRYFDPDVAREEGMNKAKLEAINHFAGHEEEIRAAIQMLSAAKSKVPDTDYIVDPFAKNQNSIKDFSFRERLVPGLTTQVQVNLSMWLDLNPSIGYQVTNRIVAGTGWNERIGYDLQQGEWDGDAHCYGIRSFVHYKLKDYFWLKTDLEIMNINPQKLSGSSAELSDRMWVWAYLVGVKRDFKIAKKLSGNVQMLYNLWSTESQRPYVQKFNVRIGIELSLLRKQSKVKDEKETNK